MLHDLPETGTAHARLLLAHGAGAPMDSAFMNQITALLAARGIAVTRFEFSYMAARRTGAARRPPPRAERLVEEFANAIVKLTNEPEIAPLPLLIGGKSMGGRIATMLADQFYNSSTIKAVVALGYPFHPSHKPDKLRTAHLENLKAPLLIAQGERDTLGTRDEVQTYRLSKHVEFAWATDGDHDLKPRRSAAVDHQANLNFAADAIADFSRRHATTTTRSSQ